MLKKILIFAALAALASPARAQSAYYGLTQSTTTGRASMTLSGQMIMAASTATATTPTIILQGNGGRITANGITLKSSATVQGPLEVWGPISGGGKIAQGMVDLSTVAAQFNAVAAATNTLNTIKLSTGVAIPAGLVNLSSVTTQFDLVAGATNTLYTIKLSTGVAIPQSLVNLSTVTTQFNTVATDTNTLYTTKLSTGVAIPTQLVNLSTVTTQFNTVATDTNTLNTAKLSVNGTNAMSGQLTVHSTVTITGNAFSVGGSTFVVIGGNVGIGTTAPMPYSGVPLTIKGEVSILSQTYGSGAQLNFFSDAAGANNSMEWYLKAEPIWGDPTYQSGTALKISHPMLDYHDAPLILDSYGWAYFKGMGNRTRIFLGQNVTHTGLLSYKDDGLTDDFAIENYSPTGKLFLKTNLSGKNNLTLLPSGEVGVNMTSPQATLDVNGTMQFGSGATKSTFTAEGNLTLPYGITAATATFSGTVSLGSLSGQLTVNSSATITGNAFSVGGSTFAVTGGNVGIGTASPSETLDLRGHMRLNGYTSYEGNASYMAHRNIAALDNSVSAVEGALVIDTNIPWPNSSGNTMYRVNMEGYDYFTAGGPIDIELTGLLEAGTAYGTTYKISSGTGFSVRIASNTATNNVAFILGDTSGTYRWMLLITSLTQGFVYKNVSWAKGWTITPRTSLSDYTAISSAVGKFDFRQKTHAALRTLACPALPCGAVSSDSSYHVYFATGTAAGAWKAEDGSAP